jgi:hypothetical protein
MNSTKSAKKKMEGRLEMRVDEEYLERLDEWRSKQRPIPTRAEALRRISEQVFAQAG